MSKLVQQATDELREAILSAVGRAVAAGELPAEPMPAFTLEVPADRAHGDWSANAALVSARAFRLPPRKIAERITKQLVLDGTYFDRFEIAGPGFLNFFFSSRFYVDVLKDVIALGGDYGRSDYGKHRRVMVEFVSANPTGPMHMGNARGGALGDCLAAVLDRAGFEVWREFYVNDAGNQIEKFGSSLSARYQQLFLGEDAVEFPEDGYQGEDIKDNAKAYADAFGDRLMPCDEETRRRELVEYVLPRNIQKMKDDLKKYRIEYDQWFLESTLHNNGELKEALDLLTRRGVTYEKDGALWYRATDFGAEKDEVLVRQNGNPTYFAADIAYHRNKIEKRGYDLCIDVWGADHHGHVARLKGALDAIGLSGNQLDVVLMQLVRLTRDGQVVRMSKRTGKAIQLADLLDEVPVDSQNPVYYVQYANARICSILRNLEGDGIAPRACTDGELALLTAPEELELIRHLSSFTDEIVQAAKDYDPARINRYVIALATLFHKFYNTCRVRGEQESLTAARLALCTAVSTVIRNVLSMFKISAPESM